MSISGGIPETNAPVCSAPTGSKKSMEMWRPCNSFYSCCMLTILQYRLRRVLIPNKKLKQESYLSDIYYSRKVLLYCDNKHRDKLNLDHQNKKKEKGNILYYRFHQMQARGYHKTTSSHKPIYTHDESREGM